MTAAPSTEVVIVGGGLAGCAAAVELARAGREVVLLERSAGPHHKVCGEFLSAEALGYLAALGVDAGSLGAVPIHSVHLSGVTRSLPFTAMSLTRHRLDEELLRLAAEAGASVRRECAVQSLDATSGGWCARIDEIEADTTVTAGTAFLATGKHNLRGHARPQGTQPGLVGFKMYFRLSAAQTAELSGCVELLLYRGGYAGLQRVEDGMANLCCLVDRAVLQKLGGRWDNLLEAMQHDCPHLRERLAGAEPLLEKPLAITSIPYGYLRTPSESAPGLWALGDQAAVIPSFTGDGMSIALHSGSLAARMYLKGGTAEEFQGRLHRELHSQIALATIISRGLVHPVTRPVFTGVIKLWPALLGQVARHTRIAQPHFRAFYRNQAPGESKLSNKPHAKDL